MFKVRRNDGFWIHTMLWAVCGAMKMDIIGAKEFRRAQIRLRDLFEIYMMMMHRKPSSPKSQKKKWKSLENRLALVSWRI